ncbi:MAG: SRPBCC family protein [Micrococcales bacterium]|nr:SRPBCC family protein [Micrococcales bacterium]
MTPVFTFAHTWRLPAAAETTHAVLADVDRYAEWWPQVRSVRRVGEDSGVVHVRSLLPVGLDLLLTREVEDEGARRLRVAVGRDLVGWCEWRVQAEGPGSVAHFTQEVVVGKRLLAPVAAPLRPVLEANHSWMMRRGEAGLAARLRP